MGNLVPLVGDLVPAATDRAHLGLVDGALEAVPRGEPEDRRGGLGHGGAAHGEHVAVPCVRWAGAGE